MAAASSGLISCADLYRTCDAVVCMANLFAPSVSGLNGATAAIPASGRYGLVKKFRLEGH